MAVYTLAILAMWWGGTVTEISQKGKRLRFQIYLIVICVLWMLIASFRAPIIGVDTIHYLNAFHGFNNPHFEPGYSLLNNVLAFLGINDEMFLFVVSAIIYAPVFISINRYSESPWLSVMAFFSLQFFGLSLSAIRQMIAVSILTFGIKYIIERKFRNWLLVCLAAFSVHYSAICVMPLYFAPSIKLGKKIWLNFLVLELLFFMSSDYLVRFLNYIPEFMSYYAVYFKTSHLTGNMSDYIILGLLNIIIALFFRRAKGNVPEIVRISICSIMIACIVLIISFSTGNIIKRVNIYYLFYIVYFLPWLMGSSRLFLQRDLGKILTCGGLTLYFYYYISRGILNLYPYRFSF